MWDFEETSRAEEENLQSQMIQPRSMRTQQLGGGAARAEAPPREGDVPHIQHFKVVETFALECGGSGPNEREEGAARLQVRNEGRGKAKERNLKTVYRPILKASEHGKSNS